MSGSRPARQRLLGPFALAVLAGVGTWPLGTAGARFTDAATVSGTASTGAWVLYLHNRPSPPTGPTRATFGLAADPTLPATATLYDYDTDCDAQAGRRLRRGGTGPTESRTCWYADWRTAPYPAGLELDGTVAVRVFAARTGSGANPVLGAYLRDLDPATGARIALASGQATVTTAGFGLVTIPIPAAGRIAPGHALELVLVNVATGPGRDLLIAYDTAGQRSRIVLFQTPPS